MLSRIAESLFWIGRYVERADGVARILDVHLERITQLPVGEQEAEVRRIMAVMGVEPGDGDYSVRPYTFDDVVAALNAVEPYDWAEFLKVRVKDVAVKPPLDGITRGGWKLVYTENPTGYFKAVETARKQTDLTYSLGVALNREGEVTSVLWDSPAFNAGLTVSTKILAVDGIAYDADRLKQAITAAKDGRTISLLVKNGDHFQAIPITYRGGLRYPRLQRVAGTPDLLSEIYRAK